MMRYFYITFLIIVSRCCKSIHLLDETVEIFSNGMASCTDYITFMARALGTTTQDIGGV